MDSQAARDCLNDATHRKPSELGEAIHILYDESHSYEAIATQVPFPTERLSQWHKVFLLPEGIRWQVDEGKILLGHVQQISRLAAEEDRWLLAFTIVQEGMSVKDSTEVVRAVVRTKRALRDVLNDMIGIRFDKPFPCLLVGITFEDGFRISRAAWTKKLKWEDFSLAAIQRATRVDIEQVAVTLKTLADQLRSKPAHDSGKLGADP